MNEYPKTLKKGLSMSFFGGQLTRELLDSVKAAKIDCIEMSGNVDKCVHGLGFLERAEQIGQMISDAQIQLWSLHLPFGSLYDVSNLRDFERDYAIALNTELIKASSRAGAKVCVLHATSGLFGDEEYRKRLPRANSAIIYLADLANKHGITLAVENQPKSIPTRYPELMAKLLEDSCAKLCFDTNHSLYMDGLDYLAGIRDLGIEVATLHISDYDRIDERHRMPGDGVNDWKALLSYLENIGYNGPLMYEVASKPKDRSAPYTLEQIAENMEKLVNSEL